MDNINTTEHWDKRYQPIPKQVRRWKRMGESHILTLLPLISISPDYTGSILDFGCGMGFGTVCLKRAFPLAEIIGVDHSERGIEFCRRTYPTGIIWQQSSWENCPAADIIICSHIMEHLDNDKEIVRELLKKCRQMFVAVPYKEDAKTRIAEHVNSYDETYYGDTAGFDSAHIVKLPPPPPPILPILSELWEKIHKLLRKIFPKRTHDWSRQIVFVFKTPQ
jgi:2-polyprenyl-3-methyl-5-hydroxy-6-metoxy-1,4-benzoquinol methylase